MSGDLVYRVNYNYWVAGIAQGGSASFVSLLVRPTLSGAHTCDLRRPGSPICTIRLLGGMPSDPEACHTAILDYLRRNGYSITGIHVMRHPGVVEEIRRGDPRVPITIWGDRWRAQRGEFLQ